MLGAASLALLLGLGGLWWPGRSSAPPTQATRTTPQGEALRTSATPRRVLPTRTTPDVPEPSEAALSCPIWSVDADTAGLIAGAPGWLPDTVELHLDPPALPPFEATVDGDQLVISGDAATMLPALPWASGLVMARLPGVGELALELTADGCARVAVLRVTEPDTSGLACPLSADLDLGSGYDVRIASGPKAGRSVAARVVDGALQLVDVDVSGEAWLHLPDTPPVPVDWGPDGCSPIEPTGTATVQVTVDNAPADDVVWIAGCGTQARLAPGESQLDLTVPAVPCALEAWRLDGLLRAVSPLATLDPRPDARLSVSLRLPTVRMAGLGIQFRPGEQAVTVARVWPDTPAWEAGLRAGDRILAVDGEPTGGLETNDFIALGTGPEGTIAVLTVESEDGTVDEIALSRAVLGS